MSLILGDFVKWKSGDKWKYGVVVEVVPPRKRPKSCNVKRGKTFRNEESYIVWIWGKKSMIFWPKTNKLIKHSIKVKL